MPSLTELLGFGQPLPALVHLLAPSPASLASPASPASPAFSLQSLLSPRLVKLRAGCNYISISLGTSWARNSAVFTDIMVGGPAMGDQQSQEGGYNASLKNKAEAAARGETLAVGGAANLLHLPLHFGWFVSRNWEEGSADLGVGRRDAGRGRRSRVDGGRPADVVGAAAACKSSCYRTSTECTVTYSLRVCDKAKEISS